MGGGGACSDCVGCAGFYDYNKFAGAVGGECVVADGDLPDVGGTVGVDYDAVEVIDDLVVA